MNRSSSYRPNTKGLVEYGCWIFKLLALLCPAAPALHPHGCSNSAEEPATARWDLLVVWHVTQFGYRGEEGAHDGQLLSTTWADPPRPASLDDYVPLLLITHSLDPPQLLSVVKFSSPGVFKKKKKKREPSEPLRFNIRPEVSCSGCEGPFQALHRFFFSRALVPLRAAVAWLGGPRSRSLLDLSSARLHVPFLLSSKTIIVVKSSNTKIDRRAISGFSESLSFLIKQKKAIRVG